MVQDNRQNAGAVSDQRDAGAASAGVGPEAEEQREEYEDGYLEEEPYDDAEQGFVHVRTPLFAIGATVVSLVILALLAGNVYQYIHNRDASNIASVNGSPITSMDFVRAAGQQDQALQSLIDQKLIQQEAKKEKVTVPDSQVNAEVNAIKQQLGTPQQYQAALQRANLTEAELRDQIRTKDLAQTMGAKGVTVSDDEAQTYYNQNKAQFGSQTFDQSKDQIKTQLLQQKQNEAIQAWISGLRSKAKISIHIPA